MRGLGTIINTLAVVVGGLIGMRFKAGIPKRIQDTLMQACGIATIFIGVAGTLAYMLVLKDGGLSTRGTMLLILSLVIGGFLGEALNIEEKMESVGERLKKAVHAQQDNQFVDGFVNVSLIICVGAMAIVGSIQDGITGDYSMLAAKAILDLIIVLIMAATYGIGAVFSAAAIFVYQGSITLLAILFGSFLADSLVTSISFVGSALIFCVGINISFGKKFRVGNLLPALIAAALLTLLEQTFGFQL